MGCIKLKVLTVGVRLGTFGALKDPQLPYGREWSAIHNPSDVTLGYDGPNKGDNGIPVWT